MATNIITLPQPLKSLTCANCAMEFALPALFESERRKDHKSFFCPSGHSNFFPHETEEERLKRLLDYKNGELERTKTRRDELLCERDRLRERAKKGRCPASRRCKHKFQDLRAHLKKCHARYPWKTK